MQPSPPNDSNQSAAPQLHAPGWYPDPTRRYEFRYFNGQSWTGDSSSGGVRLLDPLPPAIAGPGGLGARPVTNGKATASFVLALASLFVGWVPFLCFLVVVAVVLAIVFGVIALRRCGRRGDPGRGLAIAGLAISPLAFASIGIGIWLTTLVVHEFTKFSDLGEYSLKDRVCEVTDGVVRYEGDVANMSTSTRTYHLVINFTRPGTDNVLYTAIADVNDVTPGQTGRWSVRHVVTQNELECKVGTITGPLPFGN